MRRHGWELPYHPLQVVAIAVFLALAFAYYVFFVPFVGSRMLQLFGISAYSPLMVAVFSLYIWCAATNPADPGVLRSKKLLTSSALRRTSRSLWPSRVNMEKTDTSTEPSTAGHQLPEQTKIDSRDDGSVSEVGKRGTSACGLLAGAVCPENFCICESATEQTGLKEDMLYCGLCEVEIFKCSKHCRVCDKCVDCFDHHCRWLNNCIGRKNYKEFIALMISGISLLILQWTIGIWVIVRCLLNRRHFQEDITSKLGSSFSVVPFLCVVVVCTVLAVLTTLPLGQLCLFHALLIQKGISTYDYVVAMREQEQQLGIGESVHSPYTSPASSVATAISGASSAGALQHGAWCTPPRLFLDHEQAAFQPERGFAARSIELEAGRRALSGEKMKKKAPVKISPWALARLNAQDAVRAAAEARKKSSILRPVVHGSAVVIAETESSCESSSGEVGAGIVPQMDGRKASGSVAAKSRSTSVRPWRRGKVLFEQGGVDMNNRQFVTGGSAVLTPLQVEARSAFGGGGVLSRSSTESSMVSPDVRLSCESPSPQSAHFSVSSQRPWFQRSTSDGYEASGGESADDSDHLQHAACYKRKLHADCAERIDLEQPASKRSGKFDALGISQTPNLTVDTGGAKRQLVLVTENSEPALEHHPGKRGKIEKMDSLTRHVSPNQEPEVSSALFEHPPASCFRCSSLSTSARAH